MSENFEPQPEETPQPVNLSAEQQPKQEEKSADEMAKEERIKKIIEKYEKDVDELFRWGHEMSELSKSNPEEYRRRLKQEDKVKRKERSKTSNEKILKLRQGLEKAGIDLDDEGEILEVGNAIIGDLNKLFEQKYGLSVPEDKVPFVMPFDTDVPFYSEPKDAQGQKRPMIAVGTANHFLNGNSISEELAHFYRFQFQPEQKDEWLTHEFFGFLGRRMFKKAVAEGAQYFAVLDNEEGREVTPRRAVVDLLKQVKKNIRLLQELMDETTYESQKMMLKLELNKCIEIREDITKHQRGYEYAFRMDIDKITDWKKLFSLPNEEVRRRFFTDKQDYSGL